MNFLQALQKAEEIVDTTNKRVYFSREANPINTQFYMDTKKNLMFIGMGKKAPSFKDYTSDDYFIMEA